MDMITLCGIAGGALLGRCWPGDYDTILAETKEWQTLLAAGVFALTLPFAVWDLLS